MFTYENQKFAAFINEIAWSLRDHAISLINAYGDNMTVDYTEVNSK